MKRFFSTIFLVCFSIFLFSQETQNDTSTFKVFYYPSGKKSSEGPMRNGKPDGYWKTYYESGIVKSEGNRLNFLLDSVWKFYSEEGIAMVSYTYKTGKKNGIKKTFDPKTGVLISDENYVDDIKNGETILYFPNGAVKSRTKFIEGKEEGIAYEYNEEGIIQTVIEYKYGFTKKLEKINRKDKNGLKQGVWKEFYENGIVKLDGRYVDDKKDGYFKEYDKKGSLLSTSKYIKGVLQKDVPELAKVDIRKEYYPDGKIKYIGGYKDSLPQGPHRQYDESGNIVSSQIYEDGFLMGEGILDEKGRQQGPWKEYHPTGELRATGEYKDGKKIGEWIFYHTNGKVEQKGKYDAKGKAQGLWKWYYETGNLLKEENYRDNILDGKMIEYSDSGQVITKGEYLDGEKEGPWFYQLGDYREEGSFKSGRREGTWKHYYNANNKVRFEGNYVDGNPDGKHIYYYSNGKVQQEGKYMMGLKEGDWIFKDELGVEYLKITFANDIEVKFDGVKVRPTQEEVDTPSTNK